MTKLLRLLLTALLIALSPPAVAAELDIGIGADVTSLDPHWHNVSPNRMVAHHIYDALIQQDEQLRPTPGLATSWSTSDGMVWRFQLREGVRFHDGSPFTAADAAASIRRAMAVRDSPLPFAARLNSITAAESEGDHVLVVRSARPVPLLPITLAAIAIIPQRLATLPRASFDEGKNSIGTGPYRLVGWQRGEEISLAANAEYWRGKPRWDMVRLHIMGDAQRIAALTAGSVQLIDQVPPADVSRLRANPTLRIASTTSHRLIYLAMDHFRDATPFATGRGGEALKRNPLKDPRVRQALSKAIDRRVLTMQVMEGQAIPAGQIAPDGFFGTTPRLAPDAFDPDTARRLLAEAGWADGFTLTLHLPSDRYVNAERAAQAIATMLARVGITVRTDASPSAAFFPEASNHQFSFMLMGIGVDTGETGTVLDTLLASPDPTGGRGSANRGRYLDPELDVLVDKALATVATATREALLQSASERAIGNLAIIPLYHTIAVWASRGDLSYNARADEMTLAQGVMLAGK